MNHPVSIQPGRRTRILTALLASFILAAPIAMVVAGDSTAPATQSAGAKPAKKPVKKKLTGAELYQVNCNRCHAERYPLK
jgi:cytochrome c5